MNGSAVLLGLACAPGPDWLNGVISRLGQRLKAHNDLQLLAKGEVSIIMYSTST